MSAKCTREHRNKPRVVVEENKRKLTFLNPHRRDYDEVQIDECVITSGIRCDKLVREIGAASVLIEFKGSDLEHACAQLEESAKHKSVRSLLEDKVGFVIVCSRYPRFDTYVAKAKTRFARQFKAGLHIFCDQREVDIHRLVEIDG